MSARASWGFLRKSIKAYSGCKQRLKVVRHDGRSWIARQLPYKGPHLSSLSVLRKIEVLAEQTQSSGKHALWHGYAGLTDYPVPVGPGAGRTSEQVRTKTAVGMFFLWMAEHRKPAVVVEFGSAFGLSGMYWLAALERAGTGRLYTFEPNEEWARIAHANLARIGSRFTAVIGTFEENFRVVEKLDDDIGVCFIDAIHTRDFVLSQIELVLKKSSQGTILVIDDINFSPEMRACWDELAGSHRFSAALEFRGVGVLELG